MEGFCSARKGNSSIISTVRLSGPKVFIYERQGFFPSQEMEQYNHPYNIPELVREKSSRLRGIILFLGWEENTIMGLGKFCRIVVFPTRRRHT